ncbi:hypothetical protein [Mucilaginibacter sp. FT3.2]|uniref:hypothetical protein n=1 Tax=Mucilaginibacter sp. FT3.2 TaxID=2723090 RepID=UPI0016154C47|nr:hypothetical protein [Mucilaginibacter sp. FT3.2]MBB6229879.1 hypothetical protein [Mucilaginibacter sp. FT3.2]
MIIKLISGALILFSAFMGIKHGISGLKVKPGDTGPGIELFKKLNLSETVLKGFAALTILGGLLILAPQTFVAGNIINVCLFLFLIVRFLMVGEVKPALIEIPFLLVPLALIYLKYPLG